MFIILLLIAIFILANATVWFLKLLGIIFLISFATSLICFIYELYTGINYQLMTSPMTDKLTLQSQFIKYPSRYAKWVQKHQQ